ncbi:MHYT domain-containing protein [Colwellia sp. MEBiC06753]
MFDWIITQFSIELFTIEQDSILIYGNYNPWLVGLSIIIAMFASFMGLQVASQAERRLRQQRQKTMLLIGGIDLGGGIWTMHFIGMLAFDLCSPVEYDLLLTLI